MHSRMTQTNRSPGFPVWFNMGVANTSLKPINTLRSKKFYIPAYQRGYRWTKQQVLDLLEDIKDFRASDEDRNPDRFYCLQPIVVRQRENPEEWEVVDGQQRITTLFLILQYFNRRLIEELRGELYEIDFETRKRSKDFLREPNEAQAEENVDFHFIYIAYQTIKEWFTDKENLIDGFKDDLLNRVKIIWYELPESENAVNAFTRLNIGKIPLTNAELIRALFLRSKNFSLRTSKLEQLKIAQEWDLMEKALQDDEFWYFLIKGPDRTNRIEFIFDLITEANKGNNQSIIDSLYSFHHFNKILASGNTSPESLWTKVKNYFQTLEEWYRDKELFHLIGYLINEGETVLKLIQLNESENKSVFRRMLKTRIFKRLLPNTELEEDEDALRDTIHNFLNDLEYGEDSREIKSALLLFNITSIIANEKSIVRFRFDYFKKDKWDIEHIRSVTDGQPTANPDRKFWLEVVCQYLEKTGEAENPLRNKATEMLSKGNYTAVEEFEALYSDILKHFDEHEPNEAEDGIGNLALLDSGTNRAYKNAVFQIKRKRLLDRDQEGTFVPLCTRNAFLKVYSNKPLNLLSWTTEDQENYLAAMTDTLTKFFKP